MIGKDVDGVIRASAIIKVWYLHSLEWKFKMFCKQVLV